MIIFTEYYLPAVNAGGPITSIYHLTNNISKACKIVSRGNDLNNRSPLDVSLNSWTNQNKNWYVGRSLLAVISLVNMIVKQRKETFYVNGIFDPKLNLLPIILGRHLVISPRGMLQQGAIAKGAFKKKVYISLLAWVLRKKSVGWHATDTVESNDIELFFGSQKIKVIPNLVGTNVSLIQHSSKKQGHLRLVYYSLISEKKNLQFLLSQLSAFNGSFEFHIFGPDKDVDYANKCRNLVAIDNNLNTHVEFHGPLSAIEFAKISENFDYFVLPTSGENFGHAIVESLMCGLPVIISDKTPWKFVGSEFNFSLDINDVDAWNRTLQRLVAMDEAEHLRAKLEARNYFETNIRSKQSEYIQAYEEMFEA